MPVLEDQASPLTVMLMTCHGTDGSRSNGGAILDCVLPEILEQGFCKCDRSKTSSAALWREWYAVIILSLACSLTSKRFLLMRLINVILMVRVHSAGRNGSR